jgi:hypothetical protein
VSATDAAGTAFPASSGVTEISLTGSSWVGLKTAGSEDTKLAGGAGISVQVSSPASAIAKARNP